MNQDQRIVYNAFLESIRDQSGRLFFVYGAGGTGKTYLYRTLIASLRSTGKVVIPVATAGIAALLLPGGRTAHSRFKLPLTLDDHSMCNIHRGSSLATLLSKADLIIWDEAPMAHRHAFETLDRSLRDLLSHEDPLSADKPFGGKTVLLGGDFRQILPVVPHGKRSDTVLASLSKSYLWNLAKVFTLSINMRLRQEDKDFAKWILEVGDGDAETIDSHKVKHDDGDQIIVDESFLIPKSDFPHEVLASAAYPNFLHNYRNKDYLRERAVLTPTNSTIHEVNSYLLSQVPSQAREYLSSDSVEVEATPDDDWTRNYPQEYLNSLEFPGLPNHRLCLKVGAPVMMLRNLNQDHGLCNGTRMVVSKLDDRIIEVEIMTGSEAGERILLPRIQLSPTDTIHPFTFRRRQYPGQLYVAMSRVTTPGGLKILDNTSDKDYRTCDPEEAGSCDSGCNGGLMNSAFEYTLKTGGLVREEDYPYTGKDGATCKLDKSKIVASVSNFSVISIGEEQIAANLVKNGPLAVAINAAYMQTYIGGVSCPYICMRRLNHGVLLVGYC
ncbi:ATP-dependent DNA helicase pif1-like [Brassica napus]|uniref:ATP-dependent DNA helicase pif1-like n=1 Tax=Brassica napus TaxID=3708 RepID=UPI0020799684|nr:ATP-dependent DNA helicase pif1-like [Brassica napus]